VSFVERMPLRVGDRTLLSAPIFHSWGYSTLFTCLGLRHTIVLQRRFDPADAWRALEARKCTVLITVPTMLQRMTAQRGPSAAPLRHLRIAAVSGSALPHGFATAFMDQYGDVLYCFYGSTEASWVCVATPADLRRNPATVGTPPLGTVVRIVDRDGHDVAPGETGRIYCGNEMTFAGYTSGEGREGLEGLVDTGDLGHVADGLYFLDGREDGMVVSGGENVYPDQVATLLAAHPAVQEVAVTGLPDPEFGTRLGAFVVVREGQELDADDVRDYVRDRAARHCVPREVVFLDALPRNAMGKVPADDLRELITGT
jgi:acyl-CoA synthetase (AMP-forming)/AMP-acid ligase II